MPPKNNHVVEMTTGKIRIGPAMPMRNMAATPGDRSPAAPTIKHRTPSAPRARPAPTARAAAYPDLATLRKKLNETTLRIRALEARRAREAREAEMDSWEVETAIVIDRMGNIRGA